MPLDFLDGSSVLAPMPAGARPEDVHVEEEYIEPVKEEAPENVSMLDHTRDSKHVLLNLTCPDCEGRTEEQLCRCEE